MKTTKSKLKQLPFSLDCLAYNYSLLTFEYGLAIPLRKNVLETSIQEHCILYSAFSVAGFHSYFFWLTTQACRVSQSV